MALHNRGSLKEDNEITLEEMGKKLNLTRDGVKYHITKLQKQNIIKHEGKDNKGYWRIINEK